jgi:hypothetical protein
MEILIITQNGEFIEVLKADTYLQEWANNWVIDTGKYLDIDYHENGIIICTDDFISISADNGIINLDILRKTI